MGLFKKIFKPVSKVLDKIIHNEIKPALPFAAAFAPFLLGPGAASGSAFQKLLFNPALLNGSAIPAANISEPLAKPSKPKSVAFCKAVLLTLAS